MSRTQDDDGGSDEAPDTAYDSETEAEDAAEEFARARDDAPLDANAEDYLERQLMARIGKPDADGEWCVYWETSLDDEGPRERYASAGQAEAAAQRANAELRANHPGGNLLCAFSARRLVGGEWIAAAEES